MYTEKEFFFRTSDFDCSDQLKISSVLDICQYISGIHADMLGVGFESCKEKGQYWVISKLRFKKLRDIKHNEELVVSTWPLPTKRIEFIRNCVIKDKFGNNVIECETYWFVINESRKILRSENVSFNSTNFLDKTVYNESMSKLNYNISQDCVIKEHKVENYDLDHNGHLNNARYADLILNFWDISNMKKYKEFEISFHKEALLGDTIKIYNFKDLNDEIYVGIVNDEKCFTAKVKMEE